MTGRRPRLTHEQRVVLLAFGAGFPAVVLALLFLWLGNYSLKLQWTVTILLLAWGGGMLLALRERVVRPLQTLSNLVAALSEGDFSIRARDARPDDALGLAYLEVNQLTNVLQEQRLGAVEADALLGKVMGEVDVAVLAFDDRERLKLVNPAGARLLGASARELAGREAASLGLGHILSGDTPRIVEIPGGSGRWELRRGGFRQEGRPHQLVVLADLSRTLREEERQAWRRLVRVLSHEINNSLAPIRSLSETLRDRFRREPRPADLDRDVVRGLEVIGNRAEGLIRFMQAYARLARLPPPIPRPVNVDEWVRRIARLETRIPVVVAGGPPLIIQADGDQLDQVLINLVGNAVDAALETGGGVRIGWERDDGAVQLWVEDDGPGLEETANLFVPFFTTKPGGSGIGLTLSRQIVEGHGGAVSLRNRREGGGCIALIRLPLAGSRGEGGGRVSAEETPLTG